MSETTGTGTRTIFTITGNTVLDWGQFHLGSGSELVFDFVGGDSVVNMLNGGTTQVIAGTVTGNGSVGFFSPNAPLRVTGTVTADNVTLATLNVDQAAFNSGGTFTMTGGSGAALTVSGSVTATSGNVVLAGKTVRVTGSGLIQADGAVRMGGGSEVTIARSGFGRRLRAAGGDGAVLHLGETRASRIEIAASHEINNGGKLDTGSRQNRIFLEVGGDGRILREGSGIMVGRTVIRGNYDDRGIVVDPDVDSPIAAVNAATVKIPVVRRPDGTKAASSRTLVNDVPMSASADSGRDQAKPAGRQVVSRGNGKPLLQRASFFGMRGGSGKR
jgi:hypothetical protein